MRPAVTTIAWPCPYAELRRGWKEGLWPRFRARSYTFGRARAADRANDRLAPVVLRAPARILRRGRKGPSGRAFRTFGPGFGHKRQRRGRLAAQRPLATGSGRRG